MSLLILHYEGRDIPFEQRLRFKEARLLESVTGKRIGELEADAGQGGATGLGAFLWLSVRRELGDAAPSFKDFDFDLSDIEVIEDDADSE